MQPIGSAWYRSTRSSVATAPNLSDLGLLTPQRGYDADSMDVLRDECDAQLTRH